jgi:hypothetical protein
MGNRGGDRSSAPGGPERVSLASPLARGEPVLGKDADDAGWGLAPEHWQPVGEPVPFSQRAVLLWWTDGSSSSVLLRARRAYDSIFPTGTPVSARTTERGIEIVLPLSETIRSLRRLAGPGNLPDAVTGEPAPHATLRGDLRREGPRLRGNVQLILHTAAAAGGGGHAPPTGPR